MPAEAAAAHAPSYAARASLQDALVAGFETGCIDVVGNTISVVAGATCTFAQVNVSVPSLNPSDDNGQLDPHEFSLCLQSLDLDINQGQIDALSKESKLWQVIILH